MLHGFRPAPCAQRALAIRDPALCSSGTVRSRETRCSALTMNKKISVQGKHMEGLFLRMHDTDFSQVQLTPAIEDYAQKKVAHAIQAYQVIVNDVDVKLSVRGGDASRGERQQKMEVTIRTAKHGVLRAEETRDDLYASIDVASDKIGRSLRKLKEKAVKKGQWPGRGFAKGAAKIKDVLPVDEQLDKLSYDESGKDGTETLGLDLPKSVSRTKVFYLEPMNSHDAIDALERVDHDFYIYLDKDSGHVQAVYKRKEGDHGVIITVPDEIDRA